MAHPFSFVFFILAAISCIVSGEVDEIKQNAFNEIKSAVLDEGGLNRALTIADVFSAFGHPIDESFADVGVFFKSHGIGVLEKEATFSTFDCEHQDEVNKVIRQLTDAPSFSNFIKRGSILRVYLNPGLYYYALRSVLLENRHGFFDNIISPHMFHLAARRFFADESIWSATQRARGGKRIGKDFKTFSTGSLSDPEHRLAWFREDIGLNAFHYTIGLKRMSSALYIYAGQFINTRYNVERLAAGLTRVQPLNLDGNQITIEEGYDPHLSSYSGRNHPAARPAGMTLQDDTRTDINKRTISEMKYIRGKLIDAIRTNVFIDENGESVPVTYESLGYTAKGPVDRSVNRRLYGDESFAMLGHVLLSAITDPNGLYNQEPGVVGDGATSLRDPVTYRWISTVNDLFAEYQENLPSYRKEDLQTAVVVEALKIQMDEAESQDNVLKTFVEKRTVDVGMDPSISSDVGEGMIPVEVGLDRLNHQPFHYHIRLFNKNPIRDFTAAVRIFIAPKNDSTGTQFKSLNDQREFFIEMDKFVVKLRPGENVIKRSSASSSVSHPVLLTFDEQRHHLIESRAPCRGGIICGWPHNLLVPRGTTSGMDFDLFAMVTDWSEDRSAEFKDAEGEVFYNGVAVCGAGPNLSNPDGRAMGFPFDRKFQEKSLYELVKKYDNMGINGITIYHNM